jgi:hypothetical protein
LSLSLVDDCFARYSAEFLPIELPPLVPPYVRLPFARELADGPGWQLGVSQLGWQAANVANERFDDGWRFVPGSDPNLTSPLLAINTASYRAITIRLANGTRAHDAQLFLIGADGHTDESHSLRWELRPGTEMQTYTLELQGVPGWQGIVTRLRIDPVGVGDGGEVRVQSVRLVP